MNIPEILSALTTPFDEFGDLQTDAFRANLKRIEPLVDGVFVGGTTGEFLALELDEMVTLLQQALEVFGAGRVVAHIGGPSLRHSLRIAEAANGLGVERFAAITPYYLRASAQGVGRYWGRLKEAVTGELYGYIFPDVAVTDVEPAGLTEVLKSGIDGLKVSGLASTRVKDYLHNAPPGFKLWSGNDADLPAVLSAGGVGTVSGVSGVVPLPWKQYRNAWQRGDSEGVAAAQGLIEKAVQLLGPSITNLKYGLTAQGLFGGECRMEIDQPSPQLKVEIEDLLAQIESIA